MAAKGTTKKGTVTVKDDTVDATMETAENWWYNLSATEQEPFRDKFKAAYAPTNEEILAVYEETHEPSGELKPATQEQALAWWQGLSRDERAALRDKFQDPPEDVMEMYDTVHAPTGGLSAEQQHTGEEPPTAQPATPYASATNPDLMREDMIAGENAALYDKSPIPGGYKPPPPPEPLP
jgi:hypothetical protein